ncbi:unnamed protein product, partial [Ectocarpus fasciculatus]
MATQPTPARARTPSGRRSPVASVAGSESSAVTDSSERKTPNGIGSGGFAGGGGGG